VTKRNIQRWISFATALILLVIAVGQHFGWFDGAVQQAVQAQPGLYAIDHFVDGDTIAVKMDGKVESIRMIGVDTPETHKPNAPVQCYGPAAAAYTKNLIGTNSVRLESDEKSTNRDRYNRLLRYVYLPDGRLVEAESIKNGYAFAYTDFPFTKSDEFVKYQAEAKAASKGLWGNCTPYQESNGRWQTENAS
jgi:micrococcal nuclease